MSPKLTGWLRSSLCWHRQLIAQKWTHNRCSPGRPRTIREIADLAVRVARENSLWGYSRILDRHPVPSPMHRSSRERQDGQVRVARFCVGKTAMLISSSAGRTHRSSGSLHGLRLLIRPLDEQGSLLADPETIRRTILAPPRKRNSKFAIDLTRWRLSTQSVNTQSPDRACPALLF